MTDQPGLSPGDVWPAGVGRHVLQRCASTNAEALRLAPALTAPAWVMALEQTAGRGRRGRAWRMQPGNFAASLAMRPNVGAAGAALYGFIAGLALHDVLVRVCGPRHVLAIKWPNDVLLNGRKVAGILLEGSSAGGGQPAALAIGIGVNLAGAPGADEMDAGALPAVSVAGETGRTIAPSDFLDLVAPAFANWQGQLETQGFGPIRTAWLARAAGLGTPIVARSMHAARSGIFEGIDDSGALILTTPEGREIISAADIQFGEGA